MRSKTLLISNILSTLYAGYLLWFFGGAIIAAGGMDYIEYCQQTFGAVFDLVGFSSVSVNVIYAIVILLLVHIGTFTLGSLLGWCAYLAKKSGLAKFSSTLYLIGTICFPIYFFFGLPLAIIGYIGGGKQKKINNASK